MNNNYEEKILEAIETIVQTNLEKNQKDKTIKATILKCEDAVTGKYLMKYQNSNFYAYSANTTSIYPEGTLVYVLIPNGDNSQNRMILDLVNKEQESMITSLPIDANYQKKGNGCLRDDKTIYSLSSYKTEEKEVLTIINEDNVKEYLDTGYLLIEFNLQTSLNKEQQTKGNYGLKIVYNDNNELTIDINNFSGNPYKITTMTKQSIYLNIGNTKINSINKILIFDKDFPNQDKNKEDDIFFSNINIYGVEYIEDEVASGSILYLQTPDGSFFEKNDNDKIVKRITAGIRTKGRDISLEDTKFYWFKENDSIDATNELYNSYGGAGWEFLNNSIKSNSINVLKENATARNNNYKCVAVMGDLQLSSIITIKNYDIDIELSIESSDGVYFYYGIGSTTLTCLVNGQSPEEKNYTFSWSTLDNNYNYSKLQTNEETLNLYKDLLQQREQLLLAQEEEVEFGSNIEKQLEEINNQLTEIESSTLVYDNIVQNLDISTITDQMIYKCSVYKDNEYIGVTSITIYNKVDTEENYTLQITGGNTLIKYDEYGISPTSITKETPMTLEPFTFIITNKDGLQLEEKAATALTNIQWSLEDPDNSLIILDENVNNKKLEYTISDIYNPEKRNNRLKLSLDFRGRTLSTIKEISILKEGDNGTNGTIYSCRIIPNQESNEQAVESVIIKDGVLNYNPQVAGKWFRLQFYKNGELIFDDYQSGRTSENNNLLLKWEVLKNKYTTGRKDYSSIEIDNGTFSYSDYFTQNEYMCDSPANIVKCTVTYKEIDYYITMPVITVKTTNSNYIINYKAGSGYQTATYDSSGRNPQYRSNPFEIQVLELIDGVYENVSLLKTSSHRINYEWVIKGQIYDKINKVWTDSYHLLDGSNLLDLQRNQAYYIPEENFNGECVTNGLECILRSSVGIEVGRVHIPIHLMLNRYSNSAINGWDGNSIELNEEGGYILAPQIGMGKKNDDNSFTGLVMGTAKSSDSTVEKIGLLGYSHGVQSLFIDSETGGAIFGKNDSGQIVIDPSNNKSYLFSHDYWDEYDEKGFPKSYDDSNKNPEGKGMLIDLTTPRIDFGSGKFKVDEYGNLSFGGLINNKGLYTNFMYPFTDVTLGYTYEPYYTYNSDMTKSYLVSLLFTPDFVILNCYIPLNFTIDKATLIIDQKASVAEVDAGSVNNSSSCPSWAIDLGTGSCTIQTSASDGINIYAVPDNAFYNTTGSFEDAFLSGTVINFSNSVHLQSFEGMPNSKTLAEQYDMQGIHRQFSLDPQKITNALDEKGFIRLVLAPNKTEDFSSDTITYTNDIPYINGVRVNAKEFVCKNAGQWGILSGSLLLYGYISND